MPSPPFAAQPISNTVFANKVNKYCHCDNGQNCKTATKKVTIQDVRNAEEQRLAVSDLETCAKAAE